MTTDPTAPSRLMLGERPARRHLVAASLVVLALNPVAAAVAMLAVLPAQFGASTVPGNYLEWLVQGSAISAPIFPIALLLAGAMLARRPDRWGIAGAAVLAFAAVSFIIGGLGETFWRDNNGSIPEVSAAVLTATTVAWVLIGLTLLALAARAVGERR